MIEACQNDTHLLFHVAFVADQSAYARAQQQNHCFQQKKKI